MRGTLGDAEAVYKLDAKAEGGRKDSYEKPSESLDFQFALATVHLQSLMSVAVMCDCSAEDNNLTPEMAQLMASFSENLHRITYGLDEAIGRIARLCDFKDWLSVYQFKKELIEHLSSSAKSPR